MVAIPQTDYGKLIELIGEYVEQILFMYQLPYVNAEKDTGKRILSEGGLLHLVQEEIETEYLNLRAEGLPWSISSITYNPNLDTGLECSNHSICHGIYLFSLGRRRRAEF